MSLDQYVTLGRSGLRVSPFCLGAMTFGEDLGWGSSVADSEAILDGFIDHGGNFIDTANLYTKGHSEKIIGDHVGRDPEKRDRLVIATKFSANHFPGDPNGGGSSRKSIILACEHSLRRLQTDYIDLYWLHNWDKHTPIEETMQALHDLVQSGKVRYVGVSDTPAWKTTQAQMIAQFRGWSPFIGLQVEYSLLERSVEGELIPMGIELGMGVTPWSPLRGGVLSGKYQDGKWPDGARFSLYRMGGRRGETMTSRFVNDKTLATTARLAKIASDCEMPLTTFAVAWTLSRDFVGSSIIGVTKVEQLDELLNASGVKLPESALTAVDAVTRDILYPMG